MFQSTQYYRYWLAFAFILIAFQNCGTPFSGHGSGASFSSFCKSQVKPTSPFQNGKLQLESSLHKSLQKVGTEVVSLSLVINTDCLKRPLATTDFLGQNLIRFVRQNSSPKMAIDIDVSLYSREQITEALNKNSCLIGLTENKPTTKNQFNTSLVLNDPQAPNQAHLSSVGFLQSQNLQNKITEPVVIAVVDTGVDYNHQDISGRMWKNATGEHGANFITPEGDILDDEGHGTHVAGIMAAEQNNSFAGAGLLGNFVKIMAVKSLDHTGGGSSQSVYNGIQYAIANGADIINLSLEAAGKNTLLEDALNDAVSAGVIVTVAAGNQGELITATNLHAPAYIGPSLGGVLSVASIDTQNLQLSSFSNFSSEYTEISAPGAERSGNDERGLLSTALNNGWARIAGTSQAAPIVASAAALIIGILKTKNISYTPSAIETFIKSDGSATSESLGPFVHSGSIVHLGFLSQNLDFYLQANPGINHFSGDGTGQSCQIQ